MSVLVKICGVTARDDIAAAADAGVDAVGFVFHAPSPRNLKPAEAAVLAAGLPAGILRVAVTRHPSQAQVDAVLTLFRPDVWQTDAGDFDALELPAAIQRWPVLRTGAPLPAALPTRVLCEASHGGVGERADWGAAAGLARRCELILGGGLDAANVAAAIAAVRPFGVDVSSGVERAPGRKDGRMIREFVAAARAAAFGVSA